MKVMLLFTRDEKFSPFTFIESSLLTLGPISQHSIEIVFSLPGRRAA
jgi:hypothetical protein